jgi:oxygen-independent coproporphyrinogen III oxidase
MNVIHLDRWRALRAARASRRGMKAAHSPTGRIEMTEVWHRAPALDLELISRFDRKGPRYTSYPTADRFVEAFDARRYASWVAVRNVGSVQRPLSLYVHLPFCSTLCYYCACNKIITRDAAKGERYLGYLEREIAAQAALFEDDRRVEQMHWGGGTPTFFGMPALTRLFRTLEQRFEMAADAELSIEIDPRTVGRETVLQLRALGFNRISIGVQDFDVNVQRAINRMQTEAETREVVDAARESGFASVNLDLIYGLPLQTPLTFNRTLARVLALRPDRIAVYNYAHLPARFKSQRQIVEADLPAPEAKLKLLGLAVERLTAAGYVYIGMDHFALGDDALALAQRQGRLHRNFQGYSTHSQCDLVGLGVSAIGAIGPTYSQNTRTLSEYFDLIDRGELPIVRGIELSPDDLVRRSVIQSLMCHFQLSKEAVEISYLIDFDRYFAVELAELRMLACAGLVELDSNWITVTPKGRMLVRSICMVFDRYVRNETQSGRYSRVI